MKVEKSMEISDEIYGSCDSWTVWGLTKYDKLRLVKKKRKKKEKKKKEKKKKERKKKKKEEATLLLQLL